MSVLNLLKNYLTSQDTYITSNGYYDNIPVRVNSWALHSNERGYVVFETTDPKVCRQKAKLKIEKTDSIEWTVKKMHRGGVTQIITTTDSIKSEAIQRKRAFWHAKKYMQGVFFSHEDRYSVPYRFNFLEDTVYDCDVYFQQDKQTQMYPFNDCIE